jgi:hypothetical protein
VFSTLKRASLRVKTYLSAHHLVLLSIFVPLVGGFITYYSVFAEPDIKHTESPENPATMLDRSFDPQGNAIMIMTYRDRFKNNSLKAGFIDRVEFVPMNTTANVEVKVTDIEKRKLSWREEQEIKITFIVKVTPEQIAAIDSSDKYLLLAIRAFDNTGKIVGETSMDRPYGMTLGLHIQAVPPGREPRKIPMVPIGTKLLP